MPSSTDLRLRLFGASGLLVSEYALGTMTFGAETDEAEAHAILDSYLERGGNLIDTADVYAATESEAIVGRWLARRKGSEAPLIATKARFPADGDDPQAGLSRRHLQRSVDSSLGRLRIEAIDIFITHCWDPATPVEETVDALGDLVRLGKIRYVALSNVSGWQLQRTLLTAAHRGQPLPLAVQAQYNLLAREIELEVVPACLHDDVGVMPWSPLGGGWLTDKYRPGETPTGPTRLGEDPGRGVEAWERRNAPRTWEILEAVRAIAGAHGVLPQHVALSWLTERPGVCSTVLGARTVEQLRNTLDGLPLALEAEEVATLDRVSAPAIPDYPYGYLDEFTADRRHHRDRRA